MGRERFPERVLLNRERFTEFEETFSLYVLANPAEASARTVADLASSFHISPNAIVRFSRKLGYEGFSDMRLSIAHEVEEARRDSDARDGETGTLELVARTLEMCRDSATERRAARLMAQARQVLIFAVGETAYPAHAFARRLSQFDGKFEFVTYENQVRREMDHDLEGTLLVLVSLSGETTQVVSLAREAAEKGVAVVSLTDLHPCALAQYARLALYCCSPQREVGGVNTTDLTPLVAALTQLEGAYLREAGEAS